MGFFFTDSPSSSKKFKIQDLDKYLREISILDEKERSYVRGLFDQFENDGVTAKEIDRAYREMLEDSGDHIDSSEAAKIREHLKRKLS